MNRREVDGERERAAGPDAARGPAGDALGPHPRQAPRLMLRVAGYVVLLAVLAGLGVLCAAFIGIPAG